MGMPRTITLCRPCEASIPRTLATTREVGEINGHENPRLFMTNNWGGLRTDVHCVSGEDFLKLNIPLKSCSRLMYFCHIFVKGPALPFPSAFRSVSCTLMSGLNRVEDSNKGRSAGFRPCNIAFIKAIQFNLIARSQSTSSGPAVL